VQRPAIFRGDEGMEDGQGDVTQSSSSVALSLLSSFPFDLVGESVNGSSQQSSSSKSSSSRQQWLRFNGFMGQRVGEGSTIIDDRCCCAEANRKRLEGGGLSEGKSGDKTRGKAGFT